MSEARVLSAQALRKTWQFRFLIQVRVCALALETLVVGCDQRPDLICLSALPDRCDPLPRFGHHVAPIGLLLGPVVFSVGLVLVGIPKNELKEMDIAFERGLWGSLIGSVPIAGAREFATHDGRSSPGTGGVWQQAGPDRLASPGL